MPVVFPQGASGGLVTLFDSGELTADGTLDTNNAGVIGGGGPFSTAYRVLLVYFTCRDSGAVTAQTIQVRLNNDSANVYTWQYVNVNNVTVTGSAPAATNAWACFLGTGTLAAANQYGSNTLVIPNYGSATAHKVGNFQAGTLDGGGGNAFSRSGTVQYAAQTPVSRVAILGTEKAGARLVVAAI